MEAILVGIYDKRRLIHMAQGAITAVKLGRVAKEEIAGHLIFTLS